MKNKIFMLIVSMIFLLETISLIFADECIGGNCGTNMSLNVTNATIPPPVIVSTITETGQIIYGILQSSGAGIGMFMQFLSGGLVTLFLMIALIFILVAIVYAIFKGVGLWKKMANEE